LGSDLYANNIFSSASAQAHEMAGLLTHIGIEDLSSDARDFDNVKWIGKGRERQHALLLKDHVIAWLARLTYTLRHRQTLQVTLRYVLL
jgi:hypothetical protein